MQFPYNVLSIAVIAILLFIGSMILVFIMLLKSNSAEGGEDADLTESPQPMSGRAYPMPPTYPMYWPPDER